MSTEPKHPPTPAELVTFARMSGWKPTEETAKNTPMFAWGWDGVGNGGGNEIARLLGFWDDWNECISDAVEKKRREAEEMKKWREAHPDMTIGEAMAYLGNPAEKTFKKWFMASFSNAVAMKTAPYRREKGQAAWRLAKKYNLIAGDVVWRMARERDTIQSNKTRKAALARHRKSS